MYLEFMNNLCIINNDFLHRILYEILLITISQTFLKSILWSFIHYTSIFLINVIKLKKKFNI